MRRHMPTGTEPEAVCHGLENVSVGCPGCCHLSPRTSKPPSNLGISHSSLRHPSPCSSSEDVREMVIRSEGTAGMFYHPWGSSALPHKPSNRSLVSSRCLPARIRLLTSTIMMGRGTTSRTSPSPHHLVGWECNHILHLRRFRTPHPNLSRTPPPPTLIPNHCVPSSPLHPLRR